MTDSNGSPPWTHLSHPTRISLLGREQSGKTTLFHHLASYGGSASDLKYEAPVAGLFLEVLERGPLTITGQTVGQSQPKAFTKDIETVRANGDGVVFLIDASDRDWFVDALEQLEACVLAQDELKESPLLILANKRDGQTAMSLQDVEHGVRTPRDKYYQGIVGASRPMAVKEINARTGGGVVEAFTWLLESLEARG